MNEPIHRAQISLDKKFALFTFIKRNRDALCNPTPATYKTLDEWADLAAAELNLTKLKPTVLSRYAVVCGCPINTTLRRSLGSIRNHSPTGQIPSHLQPTLKHAEVCARLRAVEARLASLETQLGVPSQPPQE